jgi:peptidoglycan/LPS O-acetylase OafA/YrhL
LRLDQTGTTQLKGIAILLVLISHLANMNFISLPSIFKYSGAWGVAIFLILSGYGLAQSYLKDGVKSNFLSRRFNKVLLPYAVVTALWIFIGSALNGTVYPLNTMALSLVGLDFNYSVDPTMWFVTFIALWYLSFYIVFKLPVQDILKIGTLFALAYVIKTYAMDVVPNRIYWQWSIHAYAFPAGVLVGMAYRRVSFVFSSYANIAFLSLAAIVSALVFQRYVGHSLDLIDYYSRANLAFALGLMSLMIIVRYFGLQSRALSFIGVISYELYLLEWILMTKLDLPHAFSSTFIGVPVFLLALAVSGIALHYGMVALTDLTENYFNLSSAKRTMRRCYSQIHSWTELLHAHKEEMPAFSKVEKEIVNH